MYHFNHIGPMPNMDHPLNQGKVAWWLLLNGECSLITDIIGSASAPLTPSSTDTWKIGGPTRPGAVGPALLTPQTGTLRNATCGASPQLNNLTSGSAGFSVGFWVYNFAGTAGNQPVITKGSTWTSTTGTGWYAQMASGQRPFLGIGRSGFRDGWGSTNTTIVPKYAPTRVLWTWLKTGVTPILYINGLSVPVSQVTIGSGALAPEATDAAIFGGGGQVQGWLADVCVWNRALKAGEAWADFQESAAGYPSALLRRSFVFAGEQTITEVSEEIDQEVTWEGIFTVNSVDASTSDAVTWDGIFTAVSNVDVEFGDVLHWTDAIFLLPDVAAFDQSFSSEVIWTGAFEVPPELRDELAWRGEFTIAESYGTTTDTIYWLGRFIANTDELGSGRYRR